jgi:hypothetical protein
VTAALFLLAAVLVVAGLVGVVVPALPGAALVFAGILLAAWADGFERIGPLALVVVAALAAATFAVDYAATVLGAKHFGGGGWAVAGAMAGLLAVYIAGPVGLILGPPVGAVVFELVFARKSAQAALRAGAGTFAGFLLGTAVKLGLVGLMIGVAAFAWLV